jgi:EAL domain-containing protein (putative c-di-GMP-specific phosphodiesterase class I)
LENATDLQAVHRMGCDIGQGFILARPMSKKKLIELLLQRAARERGS